MPDLRSSLLIEAQKPGQRGSLRLFFSLVAGTFILIGILVLFGSPVYIGSSMSGVPGEIVTGTWRIVSAVSDILSGFVFGYLRLTMFDGDED